jgi:hypothetical protein
MLGAGAEVERVKVVEEAVRPAEKMQVREKMHVAELLLVITM